MTAGSNDQIRPLGIPDEDASIPPPSATPLKASKIPIKTTEPARPQVRTTAPLPPPPPPPAIAPNADYIPRIRKVSKGAPKCIYFRDASQLDALENISSRHPRSTVSSLVQQLVQILIDEEAKNPNAHVILLGDASVYL